MVLGFTLTRNLAISGDDGMFGDILTYDGRVKLVSGELPDRGNAHGISCIPYGTYRGLWQWSPKHGLFLYHLVGVPKRDVIELHSANLMGDVAKGRVAQLLGCMAPGQAVMTFEAGFVYQKDKPPLAHAQKGVAASKAALSILHGALLDANGRQAPEIEVTIR